MMTEVEFSAWSAGTNLTPKGIEFARPILSSKVVRQQSDQAIVGNRRTVVINLDRSVHMVDCAHSSFWSFLTNQSLELCQYCFVPPPVKVSYVSGQGPRVTFLYAAELVILRKSSMDFVDVSSEEHLVRKAQRMPGLLKQEEGVWRCPPMEQALSQYGIGFIIWTAQSTSLQSINQTAEQA